MHAPIPPNPLLVDPILPTLTRLSLPNMISMLAIALVAVAETAYVGLLGTAPLAAMALVFPMVMLQQTMSAGAMGGGISSAISRALGAGLMQRAEAVAFHATVIGLGAGLAMFIAFLAGGPWIYRILGGSGDVLGQALLYSNTIFFGAVSIWLTNTFASIVRGGGNMKVPSATLLVAAALQVVLGGALGLGLGPFPRLGMLGIGLGQVIAFTAAALFLAGYLMSSRARVRLSFSQKLSREIFFDILRVGGIASLSSVQTVLTVLIVTALVSRFGDEALAGYGIGARLEFLLIPIVFAVGVACVPMVGMAVGSGNIPRARSVAWTGGLLAAIIVGVVGIVVALAPDLWGKLFTTNEAVLAAARSYFAWAGPTYFFFGLGLCLYFASQGAGKIIGPVLAQSVRLITVALGGWWLTATNAPVWQMFALVGIAMVVYGLAAAAAVYFVRWGKLA
ncbi:multidrug export protein MepA [Variibacter gotjawalensis]|uniref:Multidrug export protein MepA n=1 Tax=Variibacter gotjawalensis TaxID=1333996 RepID=A0A0S3PZM9_9BRAD|nr:MATE family efflux transporter [Variibacter gotjawalensis]NIK47231.1 putative MATE family efflux protein [Variibacter gotjawalensis]RZS49131.1 putative MATE family efflux protein [Variibacter gotjawalensis]BAT61393.1 multidrug export protein MepA [Variibacter gotjawalensis]